VQLEEHGQVNDVKADLALAQTKVENALVMSRVAEKAAMDGLAAIERVQRTLKAQSRGGLNPVATGTAP